MGRFFAQKILGRVAAMAIVTCALPASAYEVKRTPNGSAVRWDAAKVDVHLSSSVDELAGGHDSINATFGVWSGREGAPTLGALHSGAAAEPGYDKNNSVFFFPKGYEPAGRALAITILTYDNKTGAILDADIVVNGKYAFDRLDPNADLHARGDNKVDIYDIQHVLAHESGHALGLSDEIDRSDVLMYRYSSPNDASMREPTSDDVAGLAEIYANAVVAAPEASGCGSSSVTPKNPSSLSSRVALAFGVGFLTYLVSRRRRRGGAGVAGAASLATFALTLLPSIENTSHAHGVDHDEVESHATASVVRSEARLENGMIRTRATLRIDQCRVATCPSSIEHDAFGGTVGNVTQVFGHQDGPVEAQSRVYLSFSNPVSAWERLKPGFVATSPGRVEALQRARVIRSAGE